MSLQKVSEAHARTIARRLQGQLEKIVIDAIMQGFLTEDNCSGCGKFQCGGCPCGTSTGWRAGLGLTLPDEAFLEKVKRIQRGPEARAMLTPCEAIAWEAGATAGIKHVIDKDK